MGGGDGGGHKRGDREFGEVRLKRKGKSSAILERRSVLSGFTVEINVLQIHSTCTC